MKTNTANTNTPRRTLSRFILWTATVLLLQGCTTARMAWSYPAKTNPMARTAFEQAEPQEGVALVIFKF